MGLWSTIPLPHPPCPPHMTRGELVHAAYVLQRPPPAPRKRPVVVLPEYCAEPWGAGTRDMVVVETLWGERRVPSRPTEEERGRREWWDAEGEMRREGRWCGAR